MRESDRALVRRMLAGDESAFEIFFEGNFPGLFRFALARTGGDEDVAEEVAQTTMTRAVAKLATYRGEATLFTWLCTFCRRELSAHYRRTRRRPPDVELVEDGPEIAGALESLWVLAGEGPEDAFHRKEVGRLVHAVLDRLPPRYSDALEWKYIDGERVDEIAARLGVSEKAAESLLTRARAAFRDGFATVAGASGILRTGADA